MDSARIHANIPDERIQARQNTARAQTRPNPKSNGKNKPYPRTREQRGGVKIKNSHTREQERASKMESRVKNPGLPTVPTHRIERKRR